MAIVEQDPLSLTEQMAVNRQCFTRGQQHVDMDNFFHTEMSNMSEGPQMPNASINNVAQSRVQYRIAEGGLFEDDSDDELGALPAAQSHVLGGGAPRVSDVEALRQVPRISEVGTLLGIGSYGCVYLCTAALSDGTSGPVAVKVFRRDVQLERNRESALLKNLQHPNLVRLYDVIDGPLVQGLMLELCAGGCLQSLIHSAQTAPAFASVGQGARLAAVLDVVHAVAYLHGNAIVHRDVKTGNCFLHEPPALPCEALPVVKLGDLGSARQVTAVSPTCMTQCVGTVRYMAPEVITSSTYGVEADVFSCGILLHEVLTGKVPYGRSHATSKEAALAAIAAGERPSLDELPDWASGSGCSLHDALRMCWTGTPSLRPSAAQLADQLQSITQG